MLSNSSPLVGLYYSLVCLINCFDLTRIVNFVDSELRTIWNAVASVSFIIVTFPSVSLRVSTSFTANWLVDYCCTDAMVTKSWSLSVIREDSSCKIVDMVKSDLAIRACGLLNVRSLSDYVSIYSTKAWSEDEKSWFKIDFSWLNYSWSSWLLASLRILQAQAKKACILLRLVKWPGF